MSQMTHFKCAVHGINFACEVPGAGYVHCPLCLSEELAAERLLRAKLEEQRNLLLQVIDLKLTLVREGAIQAG